MQILDGHSTGQRVDEMKDLDNERHRESTLIHVNTKNVAFFLTPLFFQKLIVIFNKLNYAVGEMTPNTFIC